MFDLNASILLKVLTNNSEKAIRIIKKIKEIINMKLDVPLLLQEKDSYFCVLAALSMIMKYHGFNVSIEELQNDQDARITDMGAIGYYLLKKGFKVEIIMFHPRLFTLQDIGKSRAKIMEILQSKIGDPNNMDWDDDVLEYLIKFLQKGGSLEVKIPDLDDIESEINAGRSMLVTTDTNFLNGKKAGYYLHANVISGIDEVNIHVNDSLWDERGGKNIYGKKDYLYGIHIATHGNFNNGSLLKIIPPGEKK